VTVATKVVGSRWRLTCGGTTTSSGWWYRISAINGKSVKSLYKVTYLYAARGLFKALPKPIVIPPKPPANGLTEGIDISHWQGTIDWVKVAAAGKRFAFMKASEDIDYVDVTYPANRAAANANGIIIGAYHFAQPDLTPGDAIAEADHFIDTAQIAKGDLLPVLDLEVAGGLDQTQLQDWVRGYLGRIYERTGVRGVIYMSPNFWVTYAGDTTWFADNGYKVLWIAHWTTATAPTVPADAWGGNGWSFWQYTSSGSVSGITGRVDLDRFNGTDFTRVRIP
jgi:GH25 family lysozyme M1 (1,4-beta-N-acetylmuramidase)